MGVRPTREAHPHPLTLPVREWWNKSDWARYRTYPDRSDPNGCICRAHTPIDRSSASSRASNCINSSRCTVLVDSCSVPVAPSRTAPPATVRARPSTPRGPRCE